jgi:alkylation response protein AidB-like acyl-CoA dehydrogenase
MQFDFDEDQQHFIDSVEKYLHNEYTFEHRRAVLDQPIPYFDAKQWRAFGAMGWLGISLPEEYGGSAAPLTMAITVVEAFGKHLVVESFANNILACGSLLIALGSDEQKTRLLPTLASGEMQMAFAHAEHDMGVRGAIRTTATTCPGGYRLSGRKTAVPGAATANYWFVTAQMAENATDQTDLSVWLVDAKSDRVHVAPYRGIDGAQLAELTFDNLELPTSSRLRGLEPAHLAIEDALALLLAATCVEAAGAMSALQKNTLDYVKVRKQFGSPLGKFQILQHRLVDMFTQVELSRPLAWLAVSNALNRATRPAILAAAKTQISAGCRFVAENAMQTYGAIGMTDELNASHYFRRLIALEKHMGDQDHHLGILAEALANGSPTLYN